MLPLRPSHRRTSRRGCVTKASFRFEDFSYDTRLSKWTFAMWYSMGMSRKGRTLELDGEIFRLQPGLHEFILIWWQINVTAYGASYGTPMITIEDGLIAASHHGCDSNTSINRSFIGCVIPHMAFEWINDAPYVDPIRRWLKSQGDGVIWNIDL